MRKGDTVRVIAPVLEGEITKVEFDDDADVKRFKVDLKDENGNSRERWLNENQVELVQ